MILTIDPTFFYFLTISFFKQIYRAAKIILICCHFLF